MNDLRKDFVNELYRLYSIRDSFIKLCMTIDPTIEELPTWDHQMIAIWNLYRDLTGNIPDNPHDNS